MNLTGIGASILDDRIKGIPGHTPPFAIDTIAAKGWNVLREDLNLPLAVLKQSAIAHNSAWMRDFIARHGAVIAPHGKTTMAPQLFRMQLDDGAWAITLANPHQMQVARAHGVQRIIIANQITGRAGQHYALRELKRDPDFELYTIVDSEAHVAQLIEAHREIAPGRPLNVFLEGGMPGGRTGVRDLETGLRVARAVAASRGALALRGVEGFEGLVAGTPDEKASAVRSFLDLLVSLAQACEAESLFAPGDIILTAGGSAFYDLVLARFRHANLKSPTKIVTRSGCYLTHDSVLYRASFADILARTPDAGTNGGLLPAIEVWAYVQSRPEPGKILVTMGARDTSMDGPPIAQTWFRQGMAAPQPVPPNCRLVGMNDQHGHVLIDATAPFEVGDMISFGVSHPCLTFDKWQVLYVVDDAYNVTSAIRTFF
jgi:D-serine dehydratase